MRQLYKGFTLIELLLVLALIAIVVTLAVPSFSKLIERNELRQSAEAVKADLQLARRQAIKQSQNVTFDTNTGNDGNWCYGFDTTTCDCTQVDPAQADFCSMKRVSGLSFASTNMDSAGLNPTFDFRRGTAIASNVCLSTNNYKLKILNNAAGRVLICSDTSAPLGGYESCNTNCP